MKIQIYTMQSVQEAQHVISLGVDHIGITPADIGLPGEIDVSTARAIVDATADSAICVAISVSSDLNEITAMVEKVRPDILHLCGLENSLPPSRVIDLRSRLPGQAIMQAISVTGPEAIDVARSYSEMVDYLILDTQDVNIAGIGASGVTHDWGVSREIVRQVDLPVILAGGLSPENVSEAVRMVQPWGVDSLTHTNRVLPEGGFVKDLERIRQFVDAAGEAVIS